MEQLRAPETPEEAIINRNKMELRDEIQKAYNRSQYDYSLSKKARNQMLLHCHILEMDYFNFFGKEVGSES